MQKHVLLLVVVAVAAAVVVVPTPAIKHKTNQGHVPVYARVLPNFGKNRSNSFYLRRQVRVVAHY